VECLVLRIFVSSFLYLFLALWFDVNALYDVCFIPSLSPSRCVWCDLVESVWRVMADSGRDVWCCKCSLVQLSPHYVINIGFLWVWVSIGALYEKLIGYPNQNGCHFYTEPSHSFPLMYCDPLESIVTIVSIKGCGGSSHLKMKPFMRNDFPISINRKLWDSSIFENGAVWLEMSKSFLIKKSRPTVVMLMM